jgi:hypothetical protein
MQNLTIKDVFLGLSDLLTARLDTFKTTRTYVLYEPMLTEKLVALKAIPASLIEDRPLAGLLAEVDGRHDGLGAAVWFITEAILRHSKASPELKAAAERIRKAFIPRLAVLRLPYATEAAAAKQNRDLLASFEKDLKAIPTPDQATLYDWVVAFLNEGDELDKLLSSRALIKAGTPSDVHVLRGTTIGLVGRARAALADEVAYSPALPRNLEALLFGYFDVLNQFRQAASTTAQSEPPPPPPAPASESADKS